MKIRVKLLPGTPNDSNRDYLPEGILGSDMVVNENGNNSQPLPERLRKFHETLQDGSEGTWYEYVPSTYDPAKKTPIVFSMHGGLMTGWGQCVYTSWSMIAEREGLIVVYPDGHSNRFWSMVKMTGRKAPAKCAGIAIPPDTDTAEENYDQNFILRLIDHMKAKYNVDESRIFMQGMSNGSGVTQQFAQYYGDRITGACISAGAHRMLAYTDGNGHLVNRAGALDIWLTCPENNSIYPKNLPQEARAAKEARYYWMKVNQAAPIPQIKIVGEDNFAFYHGKKANLTFLDVKNRDHGQTLDEACICWDYMFSGSSRKEHQMIHTDTREQRSGDGFAAAFTPGVAQVWWHNEVYALPAAPVMKQMLKYHGLNGDSIVRGEYLMVPLRFLAQMSGAQYFPSKDGRSAIVELPNGSVLQFAQGVIGCMIDDSLRSMSCETILREHELLVSVEWYAQYILNKTISKCSDVVYVTDHFAQLSYFMADLLKDLLNHREMPENFIQDALSL